MNTVSDFKNLVLSNCYRSNVLHKNSVFFGSEHGCKLTTCNFFRSLTLIQTAKTRFSVLFLFDSKKVFYQYTVLVGIKDAYAP